MFRCVTLAAALCAAMPAVAQVAAPTRTFPSNALRGDLVVLQPPEILLNGQVSRLAPGARIRDMQNMLQLSGALVGLRFLVNYTHDAAGQPLQVWILTPAEAARQPWPVTDSQSQSWFFDAAAQQWTKP